MRLAWLLVRSLVALLVAAYMGRSGLKKKSLSKSGALAAFIVGFLSLACGYRFGLALIGFYKTGSALTKWRGDRKKKLEDGHRDGGQRSASQVFSCSLFAVLCAMYYQYIHGPDDVAVGTTLETTRLHLAYLGFFACCAGDTWASEVGVVIGLRAGGSAVDDRPILCVPPFPRVPRGTNGGVSFGGTVASALGGLFIGIVYWAVGLVVVPDLASAPPQLVPLLTVGVAAGVVGSMIDSVLGAILQANVFDKERKLVLEGRPPPSAPPNRFEHICGLDVMSNEQVNVVSTIATSVLFGWLGPAMLYGL